MKIVTYMMTYLVMKIEDVIHSKYLVMVVMIVFMVRKNDNDWSTMQNLLSVLLRRTCALWKSIGEVASFPDQPNLDLMCPAFLLVSGHGHTTTYWMTDTYKMYGDLQRLNWTAVSQIGIFLPL